MVDNKRKLIISQSVIFIIGIIVFILAKTRKIFFFSKCIFKEAINIPCIVCGCTRCIINICDFKFIEAFKYHPSFFCLCIYLLIVDVLFIYNSVTEKNVGKRVYSSLVPFYIFITMFALQYVVRLVCMKLGLELGFMYVIV